MNNREFRRNPIDSISQIDLDHCTYDDLRYMYGTGQAISSGSGRDKSYRYRHGVETPLGDIEESIWIEAITRLISRNGEMELYKQLRAWYAATNYGARDAKELTMTALSSFSHRLFDDRKWVDYIPFNRKYRPDILNRNPNTTPIGNDDYYFHHPDSEMFEAIYYNPDADAGGQFVVMQLSYRLIMDAAEHTDSQMDFYEYLDSCAVIELVDLGTLEFDAILNSYADPHPDFIGRTEENMKQLIMISQAATKECQNEC